MSYWPDYYNYPYAQYPDSSYYADNYTYPVYSSSPNVTVVYPQAQAPAPAAYGDSARPVLRSYDEYGQEVQAA